MNQSHSKAMDITYVDHDDLPVYCPKPNAELWRLHPRVYIEIESHGSAHCPYCGAIYQLRDNPENQT